MISKQKQIGVLRSLLIQEFKREKIKEQMISTLKGNRNVGKGNLLAALNRFNYNKAIRVSEVKFDEYTGLIRYFDLKFEIRLGTAQYGLFLDSEQKKEITNQQYSKIRFSGRGNKIQRLMSWIRTKSPAYWRSSIDIDTSKAYKVKKLAVAIANKHLSRPDRSTDFTTDYLSRSFKVSEYAVDRAIATFVDYLSEEYVAEVEFRFIQSLK